MCLRFLITSDQAIEVLFIKFLVSLCYFCYFVKSTKSCIYYHDNSFFFFVFLDKQYKYYLKTTLFNLGHVLNYNLDQVYVHYTVNLSTSSTITMRLAYSHKGIELIFVLYFLMGKSFQIHSTLDKIAITWDKTQFKASSIQTLISLLFLLRWARLWATLFSDLQTLVKEITLHWSVKC